MTTELGKLNIDSFLPLVNKEFAFHVGENPKTLVLRECNQGPVSSNWNGRKPFNLIFNSDEHLVLEQGTHKLTCDALGEIEIFLVPIGPSSFQAVFN